MSITTLPPGLTDAEVAERIARGDFNDAPDAHSRSLGSIIRSNVFTYFNGLIGSMWVVMLIVAPIQDAVFGFVIVINTFIGIIQEYRASRTLAKLSVISEAKILVHRDGADVEVRPRDVVLEVSPDGVTLTHRAEDGLGTDELVSVEEDAVHSFRLGFADGRSVEILKTVAGAAELRHILRVRLERNQRG